jgi:hypothetical protein
MTFAPTPPPPAPPLPPADKRTRRFSRTQRALMAGGLAAGLALGGAGISFAASSGNSSSSSSSTPPTSTAPSQPKGPGGPMHGPRGFGGFGRGLFGFGAPGNLLYGQATIKTSKGVQTFAYRVGKASGVSSTSITVTSSDTTSQMFTVTSATIVHAKSAGITAVASGDQVTVLATVSGSGTSAKYTAVNVVDTSQVQQGRSGLGFGRAGKPVGPPTGNPPTTPKAAAFAGAF